MSHIGEILKAERSRRNLSIEEISKITSIRAHIIEAIENGEFNVLPEVYIKSFIKKLCEFYEIDLNTASQESKENENLTEQITEKEEKHKEKDKKKKEKPKKIVTSTEVKTKDDYTEIFKKRKINFGINPSVINYLIYALIAVFLGLAIYFTFFFDTKKLFEEKQYVQDTTTIEPPTDNSLMSFFSKTDSLTIKAIANDTAWIRIEIDGQKSEELLMYPGMERSWNASEYVIVNQGNFGAVKFYRNDELLEIPGKRGSVVKNIRITRNEILNTTPWQDDPTTKVDAINEVPKTTRRYKDKDKNGQIKLIQPSQPAQKPIIKRDTIR